jgi:hypothetical protein
MKRFRPLLSPERRAELLQQAGIATDIGAPTQTLTATSPAILGALRAWHEADRYAFERRGYANLKYDDYEKKHAHDGGKRWLRLDRDTGGVFVVDKTSPTHDVYTIKGYGVPNRRIGTLAQMVASWREQTARHAELTAALQRGYNDRKSGHDMDRPLQSIERSEYLRGYRRAESELTQ